MTLLRFLQNLKYLFGNSAFKPVPLIDFSSASEMPSCSAIDFTSGERYKSPENSCGVEGTTCNGFSNSETTSETFSIVGSSIFGVSVT
jgi:hypothetical protein